MFYHLELRSAANSRKPNSSINRVVWFCPHNKNPEANVSSWCSNDTMQMNTFFVLSVPPSSYLWLPSCKVAASPPSFTSAFQAGKKSKREGAEDKNWASLSLKGKLRLLLTPTQQT